jgi:hypothetical protein
MRGKTTRITKQFTQINREYIFTSAELRKLLGLEGEIQNMGLQSGRSPKDIEEGKSAEKDRWYITTEEVKPNSSHG